MGASMAIDFSIVNYVKNPQIDWFKNDITSFLASLNAPTIVDIDGIDTSRCRVIVTLIHGNEPSGLIASHRWLKYLLSHRLNTATNMRFIFASVEAAQQEPILSHRYLKDGKDLNRCFNSGKNTGYFARANLIEQAIKDVKPEAVVDLHNTSGYGPAFSVSPSENAEELSLTSLFSQSLVLSKMSLGALMEQDFGCPVITIECGGRSEQQSHEIAYQGIKQLSTYNNISECHHLNVVEVIEQPFRVQIKDTAELSYSNNKPNTISGVVLKSYIEQLNVGVTCQGRVLGWLDESDLNNLIMLDTNGNNVVEEYFESREGELTSRHNLRLFMATSNADIAKSDCLFYAVKSKSSHMPLG